MSQFEIPPGGFRNFNEFFTRKLKPGARPVDRDPRNVVSPCDARLLAFTGVSAAQEFVVKGSPVRLARLLGEAELAGAYNGGTAFIYRLAPCDYHRFHFPEDGVPEPAVKIPGNLHSVNPWALESGRPILERNQRQRTLLRTDHSVLCMVEIGALCVGSIVQTFKAGTPVVRGQEKGYFQFGGSTIVVLYEPGRVTVEEEILRRSAQGVETLVRVGRPVGRYTD